MNIFGHERQGDSHMSDEEVVAPNPVCAAAPLATSSEGDDEAIVRALEAGDRQQAATWLVERHGLVVGRACMALLGGQSDAEDALQETLIAAIDGSEPFRKDGSLRSWLLAIARRRCARKLETLARDQRLRPSALPAARPPTERVTLAARARQLLDDVRPSEREALVLRFAAELSFREVGAACGSDEATARKRVSRGLSRLRALLAQDEK
jgi:RNA polymerase sigma-70 factor (ECF subfamily)